MEDFEIIAKGDDWFTVINKNGELHTIKHSVRVDTVDQANLKSTQRVVPLSTYTSAISRRIAISLIVFFGLTATGCITDHAITHYQLEKMIERAIKSNPEFHEFMDS